MSVKSSDNVFDVLDYLARCTTPVSGAEIATALRIPLTSLTRALSTLEAAGYARRSNGLPRFELGEAGQMLTYAFMSQFPVRNAALPYLQQLTSVSGHSCSLFQRVGRYAVRIAFIAGSAAIINLSPLGEARAFADGAAGLVFLANEGGPAGSPAAERRNSEIRRLAYARVASRFEQGGDDLAFPLFANEGATPVAAVVLEGVPQGVAEDEIERWKAVVGGLQAALLRDSALLSSPYDHVAPEAIDLETVRIVSPHAQHQP